MGDPLSPLGPTVLSRSPTSSASSGPFGGSLVLNLLVPDTDESAVLLQFSDRPLTLLVARQGNPAVYVTIPITLLSSMPAGTKLYARTLQLRTNVLQGNSEYSAGSAVIDLKLIDPSGQLLPFQGEIELCFVPTFDSDQPLTCLGYLREEDMTWVCQDYALYTKNAEYCGVTNHFTSFALLLGGPCGPNCSDSENNHVIQWLSLAFGGAALIFVLLGALLSELSARHQRRRIRKAIARANALSAEQARV